MGKGMLLAYGQVGSGGLIREVVVSNHLETPRLSTTVASVCDLVSGDVSGVHGHGHSGARTAVPCESYAARCMEAEMAKTAIWPSRLIFLEDLPRELEAHQGELRLAMPCAWRRPRDCFSYVSNACASHAPTPRMA